MEEPKTDSAGVTHVDLLVAIRLMQREMETVSETIGRVANTHDREIEALKKENKDQDEKIEDLKIKNAVVVAISGILAIVIPLVITALEPQLRFGHSSSQSTEIR